MSSRLFALLAVAALGCGTSPEVDAGPDAAVDAAGAGALSVTLRGPARGFVGEELCVEAEVAGARAPRFAWNDGDGGVSETDAPRLCVTYPFVGARTVGVTVRDDGRVADAVLTVPVVLRPASPAPTASSPIVYDAEGGRVWVVNPDADTVAVIDAGALTLEAEVPVCARPRTLAIAGPRVAVACQGSGEVGFLERATLAVEAPTALGPGAEPYGVVADPRGGAIYVSARDGRVIALAPDGRVLGSVDAGFEPRGLAARGDGAILVTRWRSEAAGATVTTLRAETPGSLAVVGPTRLPPEGEDSDTDNAGVLGFLNQVVLTPDGGRAFVPGLKANVVTGDHLSGAPLTSQTTARAAFAELLLGPGAAQDSLRHAFDDLDYASAVVFSPYGERAYFAMQGAQTIVAVDGYDFFTVGSVRDVGEAPQGLAISPDGSRLFVQAFLSRSVRVYDVSDLRSEPRPLADIRTVATEPLAPEVLEGKRIFYRSRDPRMSRTGYLSCASCHLDGEGDGLVWDFTQRGEGLRNTIELRGRAGAAPLHWTANFDEVQDFEHDIRGGQGGTGFLDDAVFHAGGRDAPLGAPKASLSSELDALAAYVASLDAFGASPRSGAADVDAAARGRAIFDDPTVGCRACHAGAEYTDSAFGPGGDPVLHDVGTLGPGSGQRLGAPLTGLDTPGLRGLYRTAPYLHDGRAATVRDVLTTHNPDDRHGVTSGLSAAQLDDLEVFLLSLDDRAP